MFKILKYITAIAFIAILFTSCEDKLELQPYDALSEDEALNTYNGLTLAISGVYDNVQDNESYGQDYIQVNEVLTNDIYFNGSYTSYRELASKDPLTNNVEAAGLWIRAYDGINQANKILHAIENNTIDEPAYARNKDRMKGEMLYLRGILHWQLVSFFAQPPGFTADNSHPGVPVKIEPTMNPEDAEATPARDDVETVYQQIISDLKQAAQLLPADPEANPKRANANAAKGFLSRVYLQYGNNEMAAQYANEVINSGFFMLLADPIESFKRKNSEESLFEIQMTESDNIANTNQSLANYWSAYDRNEIHIPARVIERYEDGDLRKSNFFYFLVADGDTTWYSNKWTDIYQNVPVLRYPEIMLNRAEALAMMNGMDQEAIDLVNMLRTRAGASEIDPANADELIEAIKTERKLELVHEGIRVNDQRRWRDEAIGNSNAANTNTVAWDNDHMILPIPQRETDVNPNLEQNPGY